MFYKLLKQCFDDNYQRHGGVVGLIGFCAVIAVMLVPPLALIEILDVPSFTVMRFIIPAVWIAYLIPGASMLTEQLRPVHALRMAVWPLLKTKER